MDVIEFHHGDSRDVLRRLIDQGVRVHAVVTDPPYYLESVAKRFGKPGSAPAKAGSDGRFARQSKGFMGRKWDGADEEGYRISFDPEFWGLIYDILLPGGYVMASQSPRTGHWQACAMEQAGFIMHPFIGWLYGQGFPKAHSVSKALDKAAGAERQVVGTVKRKDIRNGQGDARGANLVTADLREGGARYIEHAITKAATPEAAEWEGWFYGTQTLKPALEPIYVGQKPFETKTGFANVLMHGVGAMNVDACRVPAAAGDREDYGLDGDEGAPTVNVYGNRDRVPYSRPAEGRWPANLAHDGSAEVVDCFPREAGAAAPVTRRGPDKSRNTYRSFPGNEDPAASTFRGDSGSAARFFNAFPIGDNLWGAELDGQPVIYQPKATKADRAGSTHPTVKPVALMRWLCRMVTPPGGVVLDPFAGSGTTGQAAVEEGFRSILIEREDDYAADIRRRFNFAQRLPSDILSLLDGPNEEEFEDIIG